MARWDPCSIISSQHWAWGATLGSLDPQIGKLLNRKFRSAIAALLFCLACGGLAVSLWAHVVSLFGVDPRRYFHLTWATQLLLLVLLLPILVEILRTDLHGIRLFSVRSWQKRLLIALIVYYTLQFYLFIWLASDHLESYMTWRMYSAGWLLLFTLSAIYYSVRARSVSAGDPL